MVNQADKSLDGQSNRRWGEGGRKEEGRREGEEGRVGGGGRRRRKNKQKTLGSPDDH